MFVVQFVSMHWLCWTYTSRRVEPFVTQLHIQYYSILYQTLAWEDHVQPEWLLYIVFCTGVYAKYYIRNSDVDSVFRLSWGSSTAEPCHFQVCASPGLPMNGVMVVVPFAALCDGLCCDGLCRITCACHYKWLTAPVIREKNQAEFLSQPLRGKTWFLFPCSPK